MKFRVIENFSKRSRPTVEMTGIAGVGNGVQMALGATPDTRKRKKLVRKKLPWSSQRRSWDK